MRNKLSGKSIGRCFGKGSRKKLSFDKIDDRGKWFICNPDCISTYDDAYLQVSV